MSICPLLSAMLSSYDVFASATKMTSEKPARPCRLDDRAERPVIGAEAAGAAAVDENHTTPRCSGSDEAEDGDTEGKQCYNRSVLESLTIDDFTPHHGTSFHVVLPDGTIDSRLHRVAAVMESEHATLSREPFSLFFVGPGHRLLPQKIYELRHGAFPESLPLFIVPIGRTSQGFQYEAVFT